MIGSVTIALMIRPGFLEHLSYFGVIFWGKGLMGSKGKLLQSGDPKIAFSCSITTITTKTLKTCSIAMLNNKGHYLEFPSHL